MEEGRLGVWLKHTGESVRAGENLFTLEGEKATEEIESFDSGVLWIPDDAPRSGDIVRVGQVIGFLLAEGEPPPRSDATVQPIPGNSVLPIAPPAKSLPRAAGPAARRLARQLGIDLDAVVSPDPTGRVNCEDIQRTDELSRSASRSSHPTATPRARRRARELNVDWSQLSGTGRGGRIRERDVIEAQPIERLPSVPGKLVPASSVRRTIAQRMVEGVTQAAPVTLTTKVDVASLVACREKLKYGSKNGLIPSYNAILLGLVAKTLRDMPELNACWHRDAIYYFDQVNLAMAVETDSGLLAPVIHHADELTMDEIAKQSQELIAHARAGGLTRKQLEGGTFTVTNLGMFGVDSFTPILNLPQAGILGIGRIFEEPIAEKGKLKIGWTMTLSLTFDHRVVDGAPAARWLQQLGRRIEEFSDRDT